MNDKFTEIVKFIRETFNTPEAFIPLHEPRFVGNEKKYLDECIDSTFVSSVGSFVDLFEKEVVRYTGAKKAVVCVNGTNALHMALLLAGVERDDEVITQPLTFIATANAISYCGALPIFIDVDKDTLGLSPNALESWLHENVEMHDAKPEASSRKMEDGSRKSEAYTIKRASSPSRVGGIKGGQYPVNKLTGRRISACVPMHTFGHPSRIDEIANICRKYNISLLEDAAESLGSFYKGRHTGTFGEIGILSFNGNKIITSGGGGMLLFNDDEMAKKAKHLTTQAKVPHSWEFIHDEIGYNYRMPNINAALGVAQLEQVEGFLVAKRILAKKYENFFSQQSIAFVKEPKYSKSNYWLNTVLLKDRNERDKFLEFTNKDGIMTRPVWELMNRLPMFKEAQCCDLSNAEWIADRLVNIPSSVILE